MAFRYVTRPENIGQIPFRMLSAIVSRALARVPITPNQVTLLRTAIVLVSLWFFTLGGAENWLLAALLFYVFEILDHVDGDLARLTGRKSAVGPLLEQFIDSWAARPSNIFGFCIALGMYRQGEGDITGFVLFGLTALGRMLWLEYRDVFGWERAAITGKAPSKDYKPVFTAGSWREAARNLAQILYIWNNSFLLLAALFYAPLASISQIDPMVAAFAIVALLSHMPWIAIVVRGFAEARRKDKVRIPRL